MDAFSSAGADFATEQQAAAEASAAADAKAIEEGVPPAVHEGQILRQTAARKDAALAELTRLQLRTQCVADAGGAVLIDFVSETNTEFYACKKWMRANDQSLRTRTAPKCARPPFWSPATLAW